MSRYHLSEAYSNLYNPRLQENFDDNLQFIDYMLDEDIEEVVESLFWEFRDYGHSIEEAIDLLKECASNEVITESMEVLSESKRFTDKQLQNRKANNARLAAERDANVRKQTRKARVDGVIKSVTQAWDGATGGMGKAKKALSSGAKKASEYVSDKRKAGMAKLTSLMRTGAQAFRRNVSAPAQRTMRNITGETARTNDLKRKQYGAKKAANSAANRATQADAFEPQTKKSEPPVRSTIGKVPLGPASRSKRSSERPAPTPQSKPASSERKYPVEKDGQTALFTGNMPKVNTAGIPVKPPKKRFGAKITPKNKEKTRQIPLNLRKAGYVKANESFEQQLVSRIIEDMIQEAYARNTQDALDILDSLDENTFTELIQDYLND